jgi:DNA mismatch repair protein MutS
MLPNIANVHLDAVEHKDRIVFLHRLEGGPADRSYGIHVAHLAGIPKDVVRAARKRLQELEQQLRPAGQHADLFAQPAPPMPVIRRPRRARRARRHQARRASPKEALEALYRLKKLGDA